MSQLIELQIKRLAAAYSKNLDLQTYETYFDALKNFQIPLLRKAVDDCIAQETFFPTPAVIIQAIHAERQRNPPRHDQACPECAGTGYTRLFLRRDPVAMQKAGYRSNWPTAEAIAKGCLIPVAPEEANTSGVYSFAVRCQKC